jgi:cytochrome c553
MGVPPQSVIRHFLHDLEHSLLGARLLFVVIVFGFVFAAQVLGADPPAIKPGDPVAGKRKTAGCNGCHAIAGMKNVPNLGGQSPGYFVIAMRAYRDGARNHTTMRDVAGQYSERELSDLAAHYTQLGTDPPADSTPAPPAASTACAACHGAEGEQGISAEIPRLAGQKAAYLDQALRAYRAGARVQSVMQPQAATLTDEQIAELAGYYAGRTGLTAK